MALSKTAAWIGELAGGRLGRLEPIDQVEDRRVQETKEFWRHARFRDLGLLKARFRRHRYELHTHPTYVIALITEGCERVRRQQFEEKRRMLERHQADAPTGVPTRFGEAEPEPEPPFGFREVR